MDPTEASELINNINGTDHAGRVERLVELSRLLPEAGMLGFSGQAAQWLFEDVKATWLYGCFTSTVVTAHAFCSLQLAGTVRMLPDDPLLPEEAESLEQLAAFAVGARVIDVELQASLIDLYDRYRFYSQAHLHEYEALLERHLSEAGQVSADHPLLGDARQALTTAVRLVYRR